MNKQLGNGQMEETIEDYRKAVSSGGLASECVGCGQCERVCPQRLAVTDYLKQCDFALEKQ